MRRTVNIINYLSLEQRRTAVRLCPTLTRLDPSVALLFKKLLINFPAGSSFEKGLKNLIFLGYA